MAGSLKTAVIWMTPVGQELEGGQSLSEGPAQTGNPHSQWVLVRLLRKTQSQPTSRQPLTQGWPKCLAEVQVLAVGGYGTVAAVKIVQASVLG